MGNYLPGAMAINVVDDAESFITEVVLTVPRSATGDRPGIKPTDGVRLLDEMFRQLKVRMDSIKPRGAIGSVLYYRDMKPAAADLKDLSAAMAALSILLNRTYQHIEAKSLERQGDS